MKIVLILLISVFSLWSLVSEAKKIKTGYLLAFSAIRMAVIALFAVIIWGIPLGPEVLLGKRAEAVIVIDGSMSMGRKDGSSYSRFQKALDFAQKIHVKSRIRQYIYDSSGLRDKDPENHPIYSENTDLAEMAQNAALTDPKAIILLTDGNHNTATDPVLAMAGNKVPVYAVGIGPLTSENRTGIARVDYPEEISPGQKTSFKVQLENVSKDGRLVLADRRGRILAGAYYDPRKTSLVLECNPTAIGLNRYVISMISAGDTIDNKSVTVNVRKNRLSVLYLSGNPGWDLRFMLQATSLTEGMDICPFLWRNGKWEYSGSGEKDNDSLANNLHDCDVMVLQDLRENMLDAETEQKMFDKVRIDGAGLMLIGSDWLWAFRRRSLYSESPFRTANPAALNEGRVVVTKYFQGSGLFDAVTAEKLGAMIPRFPPLAVRGAFDQPAADAVVLAEISAAKGNIPFWGKRYLGKGRIMQMTASSLWPWAMTVRGLLGDSLSCPIIISGSLRWLSGLDNGNVSLTTDRALYFSGENVMFHGISPPENEDDSGMEWSVALKSSEGKISKKRMSKWGTGSFVLDAGKLDPGEYSYSSSLASGERILAKLSGVFWVENHPDHENEAYQNSRLLREIAEAAGGSYWNIDSLNDNRWLDDVVERKYAGEGRKKLWLPVLMMILLMAAEWFWRRRSGLN